MERREIAPVDLHDCVIKVAARIEGVAKALNLEKNAAISSISSASAAKPVRRYHP